MLLVASVGLASSSGAAQEPMFVIGGRGHGHGVGMGQYGAAGLASHGYDYRSILAHYYRGTKLARVPAGTRIRVLLRSAAHYAAIGSVTSVRLIDRTGSSATLPPGTYSFGPSLAVRAGARFLSPHGPIRLEPTVAPLTLDGRPYRGALVLIAMGNRISVINDLPVDSYVRGVIAWEMPSTWHSEALRAQAVAARSYALAALKPSRSFDVYQDERSQMYGGIRAERTATNRAVLQTLGEVLVWNERVAATYFSSSTGGRTANVKDVWPNGEGLSYLAAVRDPYDSRSPHHRWQPRTISGSALGSLVGLGSVSDVRVQRDRSGRAGLIELRGPDGSRRISGSAFAQALDLRSTWFTIRPKTDAATTRRSGATPLGVAKPTPTVGHKAESSVARDSRPRSRPNWMVMITILFGGLGIAIGARLATLARARTSRVSHPSLQGRLVSLSAVAVVGVVTASAITDLERERDLAIPLAVAPDGGGEAKRRAPTARPTSPPTLTPTQPPRLPARPAHPLSGTELSWRNAPPPEDPPKLAHTQTDVSPSDVFEAFPFWTRVAGEPTVPPASLEISDVEVRSLSGSTAVLSWQTNLSAISQGAHGVGSKPLIWTPTAAPSLEHETQLTGLATNTPYRIWLLARDEFEQTATVEITLETPSASAATDFRTDGDTILVNDEPTFPLMLWAVCANEVGAKLTLGITAFMGNGCGPDGKLVEAIDQRAFAVVHRSHDATDKPGILGSYYPDEWDAHLPGSITREQLLDRTQTPDGLSFLTLTNHFYSRANPLPQGKGMYPALFSIPDVIGFDLYPLQVWCRPAFSDVYDAQAELHAAAGGKPTFQWIEVAAMEHPCNRHPELTPTPTTVRTETWLAVAGGADAIGYFPNNWTPEIGESIAQTNWQITQLAPALLAPDTAATTQTGGLRVSARMLNGALYLIAVNTTGSTLSGAIDVPGLADRTMEVFAEDRVVRAEGDIVSDQFAPLEVHIYVAPPPDWEGIAAQPSAVLDETASVDSTDDPSQPRLPVE